MIFGPETRTETIFGPETRTEAIFGPETGTRMLFRPEKIICSIIGSETRTERRLNLKQVPKNVWAWNKDGDDILGLKKDLWRYLGLKR
jgi:hypothetical protein